MLSVEGRWRGSLRGGENWTLQRYVTSSSTSSPFLFFFSVRLLGDILEQIAPLGDCFLGAKLSQLTLFPWRWRSALHRSRKVCSFGISIWNLGLLSNISLATCPDFPGRRVPFNTGWSGCSEVINEVWEIKFLLPVKKNTHRILKHNEPQTLLSKIALWNHSIHSKTVRLQLYISLLSLWISRYCMFSYIIWIYYHILSITWCIDSLWSLVFKSNLGVCSK